MEKKQICSECGREISYEETSGDEKETDASLYVFGEYDECDLFGEETLEDKGCPA